MTPSSSDKIVIGNVDASADFPEADTRQEQHLSEPALRSGVAAWLRAQDIAIEEDIECNAGVVDTVTHERDVVYENKHLSRAVIIGYATAETSKLLPRIKALGIEVTGWD